MISLTGLDQIDAFNMQLGLEFDRLNREISDVFVGWTRRIFMDVVNASPQFSGDVTANWNYALKAPDMSYSEIPLKYEYSKPHSTLLPHAMGDHEAISIAVQRMLAIAKPSWRDEVWISNAAPIAQALQSGQVLLRPVNMVLGSAIMIDYAVMREEMRGEV